MTLVLSDFRPFAVIIIADVISFAMRQLLANTLTRDGHQKSSLRSVQITTCNVLDELSQHSDDLLLFTSLSDFV